METQSLDLTQHRCPMSLLLAKRASQALVTNEILQIKVVDKASLADMIAYFERQLFEVRLEHADAYSFLTVIKK
ncbi:sulfurtransferase TusA family protein [Aliivibrio fischeri]|uniref:Predicted SirA-like redox protein n=2 Tax=Aliivibrio fischeri TaxID=668 RepID=B1WN45_ALIF1|nr:sulfurtransferase TusA family protein [Aliivibrio fischeri]ACB55677.1 predicted SirA-like redox protein [Aliivibrio fischeri ES114]EHN70367.1 SirA-like redox protein [Aliivibrio fischeri SR5]KLU79294.1 response regulator SirA [Aliivibrio fischeri]MCE7554513.1 sulfurtransferase TusA family protein [Aliivibrio fischeri]MCE7561781.1 sulfurtransferase TusA family protein [Aliivibrio fischeri]